MKRERRSIAIIHKLSLLKGAPVPGHPLHTTHFICRQMAKVADIVTIRDGGCERMVMVTVEAPYHEEPDTQYLKPGRNLKRGRSISRDCHQCQAGRCL